LFGPCFAEYKGIVRTKGITILLILSLLSTTFDRSARSESYQESAALDIKDYFDSTPPYRIIVAGTEITLPARYMVAGPASEEQAQKSLLNWLKDGGVREKANEGLSQMAPDINGNYAFPLLFYPVVLPDGKEVLMSVDNIAKLEGSPEKNRLIVTEDAPSFLPEDVVEKSNRVDPLSSYTDPAGTCVNCGIVSQAPVAPVQQQTKPSQIQNINELLPKPFVELMQSLANPLYEVISSVEKSNRNSRVHQLARKKNFKASCGISYDEFLPTMTQMARSKGMPINLLDKIMVKESAGNCAAVDGYDPEHKSRGLFQINRNDSRFPVCSSSQLSQIRNARSIDSFRRGPRCLENPLLNAQESIRIFQGKLASIENHTGLKKWLRAHGKKGLDPKSDSTTRMLVSAYNGGQRWVNQAIDDLLLFNEKNRTDLDPTNWEHLRVFYLMKSIKSRENTKFFDSEIKTSQRRREDYALINLKYSESIVPRY
jgi:hypothetical protein